MHTFTSYADVRAALADPALVPVPPGRPGPIGTMAWLRASVARFSTGDDHTRRRAMVLSDLARVDPEALRLTLGPPAATGPDMRGVAEPPPAATGVESRDAADPSSAVTGAENHDAVEPLAATGVENRRAVVRALASALGIAAPDAVADAVIAASATYFGGSDDAADRAVGWLVGHLGEADPERAANRIGLLIQACDAAATLVASARAVHGDAAAAVEAALRHDPPVRVMRRVAVRATRIGGVDIAAGEPVELDVATAGRESGEVLTFGAPPRVCPGRDHAVAIAVGLVASGATPPIAARYAK